MNFPTRVTLHLNAHAMAHTHRTTFHKENKFINGIYHVMHEMRLLMPITRVLTDSLTHASASVKPIISASSNDLTHWTTLKYLFNFFLPNPLCYVFVGCIIFLGVHRTIVARLFNIFTVFHHPVIMSNRA